MQPKSETEIKIFTEAILLPVAERGAFLDRACAADTELRLKVEALLRANDRVGGFLEQPAVATMEAERTMISWEKPGDEVDRYKLLKQIGEGGYGVVFEAEQRMPVSRRVALKVVKPGMDTKSVIARFEAERQALALMDHPNIARVFDAGATASSRPYFVMELVEGAKITDYCDRHCLSINARLELFIQVCDAIQHAHQKGIIHRDIKPSNILVASAPDGKPVPKVIDFGIAKATGGQQLTDKTIFTERDMLIGTPAYMSPEQAALANTELDTRTDIYSLGVLLYELLTGATPFDTRELLKGGFDEVRRVVREVEPTRPSTRLSTLEGAVLTEMCQYRRTEPPALIRQFRGDLDWIVMMALEKDRTRRYKTANGLALDVQRFLAGETVSARPPSRVYKFQKLVLRNKLVFGAAGAVVLLLIASLIIVSVALAREKKSREEAVAASATSQQITSFLEDMLNGAGPAKARGKDTAMLREILDQTAVRLGKDMHIQPAAEAEVRDLVGKIYEQIGELKQAEGMESAALAIRQRQFGPDSRQAATSLNDLGLEYMAEHKLPEAEKAHSQALAIRRRLLGEDNPDTATSLNDLAAVYRDEGRLTEAEPMARKSLQIRIKLFGTNNLDVADSLRNLSIILGSENRWSEAKATAEQVLATRRSLLETNSPYIADSLEDVAWAASGLGQYEEAERLDGEALVLRQKVVGDAHPDIGRNLNALGQLLYNQKNLPAADAVLQATLSIQRKLVGEDDPATLDTLVALAKALDAEGKMDEAESTWREAMTIWDKRKDDVSSSRLYALRGLGDTLEHEGKWPEAETIWRQSLVLWRKRGGVEETQSMYTLRRLALALQAESKWADAEATDREALSISRKKGEADSEALADSERLVRILMNEKKFTDAKQLLDSVLTPALVLQPASANLLGLEVEIMGRQGRWPEAVTNATFALENQSADHYRYHVLAALLAETHEQAAYQQTCQKLVTLFSDTQNPYIAERITEDCLLLTNSGVDLAVVDKLADRAVTLGSSEGSDLPYFQACKAMSMYRQGRFPDAIEWAGKVVAISNADPPAKAKAFAILAMANWQLGQKNEASAALAQGNALAPALSPEHGSVDLGGSWMAWLIARISLDEATALMASVAATETMPASQAGNGLSQ